MPKADVKKAAVLGHPVSHSLSPRLHGYWLKQYHLEGKYDKIDVAPQELKSFLRSLSEKGYTGVNLTLPHKERALDIVDKVDATAKRAGSVNMITVQGGKLVGTSTDGYGFCENLAAHDYRPTAAMRALVIGVGGAARAICAKLLDAGVEITVTNRTHAKADILAKELGGISVVGWDAAAPMMKNVSLLINATPLGMKGQLPLNLSLSALPPSAVVTDIVYNPLMTPLLVDAKKRGNKTIDGLGMLLYQAVPAFEAWFGTKPKVTEALRDHMLKGLS